ncbi:MAG: hypothetical protein IKM64_03025 [Clostridia bacterium]|nr:hypothetical protein [Clostridia bacterium]
MNFIILPGQWQLTVQLFCAGLAGGLWFDFTRLPARRPGPLWLWDMMGALGLCLLYTAVMGTMGETRVRPVTVLFFAVGFFLYRITVHRLGAFCFRKMFGRKKTADGEQ